MKNIIIIAALLLSSITISKAQNISLEDTVTIKNREYVVKGVDKRGFFYEVQKVGSHKKKNVHINKITKTGTSSNQKISLEIGMSEESVRNTMKHPPYHEKKLEGTWGELTILQYQMKSDKIIYLVLEKEKLVSIMKEK
ncbi:hypothetical protein [Flammeovirga pacifica]|uniref:Beta-lactamase-inhibitor-like PepSY-like domain-containing protein n=1 Tax=Flammeovirga pacifica TaxID=915059 RepID=A0A1S1Z2X5_FLAPC|nr:hypothetical protein [Flammeovirga pacifica]OHX67445.1 hypothetical protein NH26_14380 [Flammeovirga pacifica]